jgi:hypothetical protein
MIPRAVRISWAGVCNDLHAEGHVVAIMDCCFASAAAISPNPEGVEYLVSSAFEPQATASIRASFSRRLIDHLRRLPSPEITIVQLNAQ